MRKILVDLLLSFFLIMLFIPLERVVLADTVNSNITSLTVSQSTINDGGKTTVKVEFDDHSRKIKSGDTIEVTWPTSGNIYINGYTKTIPLNINGKNVGKLDVTVDKAVFSFNDGITDMQNVRGWGEFEITARNITATSEENTGTVAITAGDYTSTINVVKSASGTSNPFYYKTGDMQANDTNHVRWFLQINNEKRYVSQPVYIEDEIQSGQELDLSSFYITVSGYRNKQYYGQTAIQDFKKISLERILVLLAKKLLYIYQK